ncbi:S41 family peptidase [Pedobacter yulinensis]|nr:S41 family peptidase [Pedobacter yulinensis]
MKCIRCTFVLWLVVFSASAQKDQLDFFKVWGFLKYHHPALASGQIDADSLFLAHLAKNGTAEMLQSLEARQQFKLMAPSAYPAGKLVSHLNRSLRQLPRKIKKQLHDIYLHRFAAAEHYYYTPKHYGSQLPHEKPYIFADTIPYAYRMLSLAKIQAAVDYIFPHKYIMDQQFDQVVSHALSRFKVANSRQAFEKELLLLTAHLNDSHTLRFYKSLKNWNKILQVRYYPPFDYQLINGGKQLLVTHLIIPEHCRAAGIQKGDIITKMNHMTIAERVAQLRQYLSVSNTRALEQRLNRYSDNLMFTTDSLQTRLHYERDGQLKETVVTWASKPDDFKLLSNYVNEQAASKAKGTALEHAAEGVIIFRAGETTRFLNALPESQLLTGMDSLFTIAGQQKGLIFDMRSYPDWAGFFYLLYNRYGQNRQPFAHYYAVDKQHLGKFRLLTDTVEYYPPTATPGYRTYNGKVVILVNGGTVSAGEYYTMFLQHLFPQSITIGSQTAGADGDEKILTLPGGYHLPFSGNSIFYPDGTPTQRRGVRINVRAVPKSKDLLKGEDTLLEEALRRMLR